MSLAPAVITDSRNPQMQDQQTVGYVLDRYQDAAKFDQPFKSMALEHWKLFRNILPEDWPYFSRFFEPETQTAVWDSCEGIMSPLFNKERPFDLEPVEEQDETQTEIMRELMTFVMREKVKLKLITFGQIFESILFGNGVVKHAVKTCPVRERVQAPVMGDSFYGGIVGMQAQEKVRLESWPVRRLVSRFDCYPCSTGSNIQEMPYFIERVIMPLQAVKNQRGWRNLDKLLGFMSVDVMRGNVLGGTEFSDDHWDLYERLRIAGYDVFDGYGADNSNKNSVKYAEILVYTEAPETGEDGGGRIVLIGDRNALLYDSAERNANNPEGAYPFLHGKKPYSDIKYAPTEGQLWQADGLVKQIENQQVKINTRSAQIGDIIERITKPGIFYGPGAGVRDPSDLDPWPGAAIPVDGDPSQIIERQYAGVPGDAWNDLNFARMSVQRHGGASDYGRGVTGQRNSADQGSKTLGGIQLLINAASQAKSFKWRLAEEQGITDGLNIDAQLVQQVLTIPQKIKILGENRVLKQAGFEQFLIVRPEDIAGRWNFFAVGASTAMDNATQAEVIGKVTMNWAQIPGFAEKVKWNDLALETAELAGMRNPSRFVMSPEEYQAKVQQEGDPAQKQMQMELLMKLAGQIKNLTPDVVAQIEQMAGLQPGQLAMLQWVMENRLNAAERQTSMVRQLQPPAPRQIPARNNQ